MHVRTHSIPLLCSSLQATRPKPSRRRLSTSRHQPPVPLLAASFLPPLLQPPSDGPSALSLPRAATVMEGQPDTAPVSIGPGVKADLVLGTESFAISSTSGTLSVQLAAMKEKSMAILKEHITKHNAPNDVPDEPVEGESDDEGKALVNNPPKKSKKQK